MKTPLNFTVCERLRESVCARSLTQSCGSQKTASLFPSWAPGIKPQALRIACEVILSEASPSPPPNTNRDSNSGIKCFHFKVLLSIFFFFYVGDLRCGSTYKLCNGGKNLGFE